MENKKKQEIEKKYSKKYHMVKFFEKKKVTRAMNKVERRLKEEKDEDEVKRLKEEQEKLQEDMDYIVHFPNDMKYVSLFKTPDKEKVEKMRGIVRDRKEEAIRKSLEGSKSEDEAVDDEASSRFKPAVCVCNTSLAAEEQDDFFMGVEDDENDDEEKEDDGENHQAEEQKEGKKKRDKR
eukprot:759832-Hanusia_phi.AAC.3